MVNSFIDYMMAEKRKGQEEENLSSPCPSSRSYFCSLPPVQDAARILGLKKEASKSSKKAAAKNPTVTPSGGSGGFPSQGETKKMRGREAAESMDVSGLDVGEAADEELVVEESQIAVNNSSNRAEGSVATVEKLLSIEQLILTSIERCSNDELKRKMYASILVVGGGAKFENFGKWLQNRLNLQVPLAYRSDQIEVTTKPKDLDPSMTVWKGASLMTCLEGSSELWILKGEWVRQGVKVLREKCPFIW